MHPTLNVEQRSGFARIRGRSLDAAFEGQRHRVAAPAIPGDAQQPRERAIVLAHVEAVAGYRKIGKYSAPFGNGDFGPGNIGMREREAQQTEAGGAALRQKIKLVAA